MFYPFDYQYQIIRPNVALSSSLQIDDCIKQMNRMMVDTKSELLIVRINWFFKQTSDLSCDIIKEHIYSSDSAGDFGVSPSFIAQMPTDGTDLQVVITSLKMESGIDVTSENLNGIRYVSISDSDQKWVYFGGSGCQSSDLDVREKSERSFKQIKDILDQTGLTFSDIVRQWNYVTNILGKESSDKGVRQNYQEFNEVRGDWYSQNGLVKNFPAATGIGTLGEGVRLEILAGKAEKGMAIISLKNPCQQDAHQYSKEQLVGDVRESTPLFERGKMVFGTGRGHIWVSGTAAIRGEESIDGSVLKQTEITCENIDQLVDVKNLVESGLSPGNYVLNPLYVRAYVKDGHDGQPVRQFLEKRYAGALIHVLTADVCREELLVEIEGEFSVSSAL